MKLTWDNIDDFKIIKSGKLRHKTNKGYFILCEECEECNNPFLMYPSQVKRNGGRYCSVKCRNIGNNPNYKGGYFTKDIPLYNDFKDLDGRRNKNDINILEIQCNYCNKWFIPKRSKLRHNHHCCSEQCMTKLIHDNTSYDYTDIKEHIESFNYKLLSKEYINTHEYLTIQCNKGHEYKVKFYKFKQGRRCHRCSGSFKKTTQQFIQDAYCKHQDKYNYKLVHYVNTMTKVKIICPLHGEFDQMPYAHLQGHGCPKCTTRISKQEIQLQEWLSSHIDINTNDRQIIKPYELDILIPDKKIAIEYNGLYWHSESKGKDRKYHLNKYNLCKDKGYRLIQIFEDEWLHKQDIVKSRLKHILGIYDKTIFARKCIIKEITPRTTSDFIEKYHIQGYTGSSIKLGIFYKEELIGVMTFAKPSLSKGRKSTNKKCYELSRFCTSCKVIGAAGKLLKYFTRNYEYDELYTFADLRWSDGNLYEKLGFSFVYNTQPNYYYIIDNKRKHRFNYRKDVLKHKLKHFDPNKTEYVNMLDNGYDRVWDCGNMKFIYKEIL